MKKVIFLFVFLLLFILGTGSVLAVEGAAAPSPGGAQGSAGPQELNNPLADNFETIVKGVITSVIGLSGVLALIAFVWGGILWMVSGGDTAKIQKGKTMMIWAVTGLVVIFAAYAILTFIFQALGFEAS